MSSSEPKAWKEDTQRVAAANAEAQRAGRKRREEHERQVAKLHASTHTKGTPSEVHR